MSIQLSNISPIDGRYHKYTKDLSLYFSEYALFYYRLYVEIKYFIALSNELNLIKNDNKLNDIILKFNLDECIRIKEIENKINHDVKAVEYYIKEKFQEYGINNTSFIHFGLTSQDINNTAINLSIRDYMKNIFIKKINTLLDNISQKTLKWKNITMLSHTHGQPAVPTTLGKEFKVFHYRLSLQYEILKKIEYYGKLGGAVGNLNAHKFAYPDIDWVHFSNNFMSSLHLNRSEYTTQIDNYDNLSNLFDCVKRINIILVDMCRDIWHYISINYLVQSYNKNEVGSSTMPHKINPINFENAEGNLMIAVTLLEFLSRKLPISRLQRDLTDSTVLRNIGTIFGHWEIAYHNLITGLNKIEANEIEITKDLHNNMVVLTEGIQTVLRKYGDDNAYEKLKDFSRNNNTITLKDIYNFVNKLDINQKIKDEINKINCETYKGYIF